jgi:diguanylate cyclase
MPLDLLRRIIVIDDNAAIHEDFRKILGSRPESDDGLSDLAAAVFGSDESPSKTRPQYRIETASQGQDGLAIVEGAFRSGDPILVAFVDIRMPPGWDGIETIERLWKVDPDLQTVICSAYSDYSWDAIHSRLGDSDRLLILKKPFDTAEIEQLAAALSEKYRLAQTARFRMDELDRLVAERTRELQHANEQLTREIEQRRSIEERLRHDVLHDRLTGLPNRALLTDRIEQCLGRRLRDSNYHFALLFMDLDDFKVVNDSLGHGVGDKLLVGIGERLKSAARSLDLAGRPFDDLTSRLGGDEFVLLLDGLAQPDDAIQVARRIEECMAEPFVIDGREIVTSMSIGIALGGAYESAADILRDADTAVYRAKRHGKHSFAVFDAEMRSAAQIRMELESDLRTALSSGNLRVFYQPIVCLASGEICGFEALARLLHPTRGLISPATFIPIAEESGLIIPMGFQILRDACRQVAAWRTNSRHKDAVHKLYVTVNLSARQLALSDLPEQIDAITGEFQLDHAALKLEITENVVMEQGDAAIDTLKRLGERGYALALDDFGTGYSSLSNLHRIPVNLVKIDQSFVRRMDPQNRPFTATVHAIINLAHNCGLRVVGEGVETIDHLIQLQSLDCDMAQGFWFSRPVAAPEAERLLFENLGNSLWRARFERRVQDARTSEAVAQPLHA